MRARVAALYAELCSLAHDAPAHGYVALPILDGRPERLGVTSSRRPALIMAASPSDAVPRDVRLRNLAVFFDLACVVRLPEGREETIGASVVECLSDKPDVQQLFLSLVADHLAAADPVAAPDAASWITLAAQLFAQLQRPSRRSLQGLWAELLVILELGDIELLARRWRAAVPHDFAGGGLALEIKSSSALDRVHAFSLSQLLPVMGLEVVIASVLTIADPAGPSCLELLGEVEESLKDPELRLRTRAIAVGDAGEGLLTEEQPRFDREAARRSLRLLRAADIPRLAPPPPEVVDVKLWVRCDSVAPTIAPSDALDLLKGSASSGARVRSRAPRPDAG